MRAGKWQFQLEAAEASGMSLVEYAAKHKINVRRLYNARYERQRAKVAPARSASAFTAIKVKAEAPASVSAAPWGRGGADAWGGMQVKLGNGVVLSWMHQALGERELLALVRTLAELPCSR